MEDNGTLDDAGDARHFELAVWPATPVDGWHAELRPAGDAPLRFERAFDLVVFLTELGDPASPPPTGLR